jgi:serine/threonine protein kinase
MGIGEAAATGVGVGAGALPMPGAAGQRALPDRIGAYRVVRVLGQGGMGIVYLAEQDEPVRREVALKVLRAGMDTERIVARFESERRALAVMEHPNITRVYDAGATESGLPYFVMERVEGAPITDYADARRLTVRERARLFTQVCRAVQHAHQKGIIHRDIKPSNVLVAESDGAPLCKVIDFGIAKAVAPGAESAHLTVAGTAVGTPAYMSPEQTAGSGLDVDTRSDIYSLGVLLYELLAGALPFEPRAAAWALAPALTEDPSPPSARFEALDPELREAVAERRRGDAGSVRGDLAGDLDRVVLKALEREREQRYATASDLALDLERYLADEPVSASPPSGVYRARKFVRRHRLAVSFAATVLVLLVAFSAAMAIQARRLAHARSIAEARQEQAEELIGFMVGDLRTRLTPIGRLGLLDEVGNKAVGYFAAVPESELSSEELFRRSQALQQLGQVRQDQGKLAAADTAFRQSLALAAGLAARDRSNGQWQVALGASHFYVGQLQWQQGDYDGALNHLLAYLRITDTLVARYPDSLSYRLELAQAQGNIGSVKESEGDAAGALQAYQASLAIKQALLARDSTNVEWQLGVANTHNKIGVVQRALGDLAAAERSHRAELAIKQALIARDSSDTQRRRLLAIGHAYLGNLLVAMGDVDGALTELRPARAIYAGLVARDSSNAEWGRNLANAERVMGQAMLEQGDAAGSLRTLEAGRARLERLLAASPENRSVGGELALTELSRSRALKVERRLDDARGAAARASRVLDDAVVRSPNDVAARTALADAYVALGEIETLSGRAADARSDLERALAIVDAAPLSRGQTDPLAVRAVALLDLGRVDEARKAVATLTARGYRRPTFVARARAEGVPVGE